MELWDAYEANGALAGCDLVRGEPVPERLYHLVVSVLVEHQDETYLLTRRDPRKPSWPGVYEASAGGAAIKGETAQQAACRELREETGIMAETLIPIYQERGEHTLYHNFLCRTAMDKNAVSLQEGETVDFCWVTRERLLQMEALRPRVLVVQKGVMAYLNGPRFQ